MAYWLWHISLPGLTGMHLCAGLGPHLDCTRIWTGPGPGLGDRRNAWMSEHASIALQAPDPLLMQEHAQVCAQTRVETCA